MVEPSPQDSETPPGPAVRAWPLLEEVISLVADWAAAAMPGNEEIARVLRPATSTGIDAVGALSRARAVVERAGPLLPADLVSRLGSFDATERDAPEGSARVRVRLALWWNEVEDVLGAELSRHRATTAAELAPLGGRLREEVLVQSIAAIADGRGTPDAMALLDRIVELARVRALLADPLAQAAAPSEDPSTASGAVAAERLNALRDAATAASEAHREHGAAGLGSLLRTAAETIRASLAEDGAAAPTAAAVDAWERSLRELAEVDGQMALASANASAEWIARIGNRIADSRCEIDALPEARRLAVEQELQAIERDVERSAGDLPALTEVAFGALRRLDALQQSLAEPGVQASLELRAAAVDLEALLGQDAARLPVSLIARARVLLDRVPAQIAGNPEGIPGLRSEIIDLRSTCSAALVAAEEEDRRHLDELRAAVEADLARVLSASPKSEVAALNTLRAELEAAAPQRLHQLRDEVRNRARCSESALRSQAVAFLKRSGKSGAKEPVSRAAVAVRAALDADDLPRLRDEVDRLATLISIPWWSRPELIGPLVAAVLLLFAVVVWLASPPPVGELPVDLALTRTPGRVVRVALVRDDRVVREEMIPNGELNLRVVLAPGRYEVYVDRQFTGRSFTVPVVGPVELDPVATSGAGP